MPLIPAKNILKGGTYIFKHRSVIDKRFDGNEILITSNSQNGWFDAVDLNRKVLISIQEEELFENTTHIYEVGDIVQDVNYPKRFFLILELVFHDNQYKVKCIKNEQYPNLSYSEGEISIIYLQDETEKHYKSKLFIRGSLLK